MKGSFEQLRDPRVLFPQCWGLHGERLRGLLCADFVMNYSSPLSYRF